jgi:hypothetical protein
VACKAQSRLLQNLKKRNYFAQKDYHLACDCLRQGFAPDYPGRPIVKNGKYTSNVIGNLKAGGLFQKQMR